MENKQENIIVKNEREIIAIRFDSLIAVTIDNYLCTFHIDGGDRFKCTKTLGDVKKLLPDYFIKIRRNTIINAQKIKSLRSKEREIVLYDENTFKYAIQNGKIIKQYMKFGIS